MNKQYTKEDYLKLKEKIIEHMKRTGEWGEYFPAGVSPFSYNESMAQDYFPLKKEEALKKGYSWYDKPTSQYNITLKSDSLPKTIAETDDNILNEIIQKRQSLILAICVISKDLIGLIKTSLIKI